MTPPSEQAERTGVPRADNSREQGEWRAEGPTFAARLHVPIGALRDWEQNRRQPDAPAPANLPVIACEPEALARALEPV